MSLLGVEPKGEEFECTFYSAAKRKDTNKTGYLLDLNLGNLARWQLTEFADFLLQGLDLFLE